MASGRDPATGRPARTEDFARDGAFARFLRARADAQAERDRPWRLVVLGDLFDFARVELGRPGEDRRRLDTSTGAAIAKLDRITAGHPEVFDALRALVTAAVPIDIVAGNHDLELARPAVQRRLRELLEDGSGGPGRVEFHPWMLYLPGVLYAEHGHQHHDINAAPQLLRATELADGELVDPPLGSELGEYITRLLEGADPGAQRLDPSLARLVAALRARPAAALLGGRAHLHFARALGRHAVRVRRAGVRARRVTAGGDIHPVAAVGATGLASGSLADLELLVTVTLARTARRLVRMAVTSRAPRRVPLPGPPPSGYMRHAGAAVHGVLRDHGDHVPFYVFGHTHAPERTALGTSDFEATYLNTGTWSELVRGDARRQTFVEIEWERSGAPSAAVLAWDDALGRTTPV